MGASAPRIAGLEAGPSVLRGMSRASLAKRGADGPASSICPHKHGRHRCPLLRARCWSRVLAARNTAEPRCGLLATRGMSRILASQNPGIKKAPGLHRAPWEG